MQFIGFVLIPLFMVYATDCFGKKKLKHTKKNLFFLSTHTFRFRLMVFDLFMFIYQHECPLLQFCIIAQRDVIYVLDEFGAIFFVSLQVISKLFVFSSPPKEPASNMPFCCCNMCTMGTPIRADGEDGRSLTDLLRDVARQFD